MSKWQTNRGILDVRVNEGNNALSAQAGFKMAYEAMEHYRTLGWVERVALYYGIGGTGTDFHDEANPFTSNAWFVYRMPPTRNRRYSMYICHQYSESGTFGNGGGAPGRIAGTQGNATANSGQHGVQCAIALDSTGADANPWQGTSNFDGADTKGSPVWDAPVGGYLSMFPRSNNAGGSHATDRENFCTIMDQGGGVTDYRYDFVSNGDFYHVFFDFDDNNIQDFVYLGPYQLRADLETATSLPFIGYHTNLALGGTGGQTVDIRGDLAGTEFQQGAVIYDYTVGPKAVALLSWGNTGSYSSSFGDRGLGTMSGIPMFPVVLSSEETGAVGITGHTFSELWGYADDAVVFRNASIPGNPPYTQRVYDANSGSVWVYAVPWAGNSGPKATNTRTGRTI